jgi:hypothetical protein
LITYTGGVNKQRSNKTYKRMLKNAGGKNALRMITYNGNSALRTYGPAYVHGTSYPIRVQGPVAPEIGGVVVFEKIGGEMWTKS